MITTETHAVHRYWWVLALRGLFAVLFGLVALIFPGIALLALIYVFAAYALIDGIMAVIVSLQERISSARWIVLLLEGLASIIIGIVVLAWPGLGALLLLYLVAVWAIVTGILEISAAFMIPGSTAQEWALALAGILSVVFGILLIVRPGAGLLALLWLVGIYAIIFGLLFIVRAFQLRGKPIRSIPGSS